MQSTKCWASKCLLRSSVTERRATLISMTRCTVEIPFDVLTVCSIFLLKAFRFSNDMQFYVRRNAANQFSHAVSSALVRLMSAKASSECVVNRGECSDSPVVFLNRIACTRGDIMREKYEYHLLLFRTKHLYEVFSKYFNTLHFKSAVPSKSRTFSVWKKGILPHQTASC